MNFALSYPNIDPVALAIGPLQIRWYALAYLAGFLLGWFVAVRLLRRAGASAIVKPELIEDLMPWVVLGVILGGRVGYILFYNADLYAGAPLEALKLWHGGMSFHGGVLGVITAMALYARARKLPFLSVTDIVAAVTPIGIFFGRIANFINGELYGRATSGPWGIVFPHGGPLPRHPSQIYEAVLEGLCLFVVLMICARHKQAFSHHGLLSGVFLAGYGLARFTVEFVREPDVQIGLMGTGLTMGQTLCLPMIALGLILIGVWKRSRTL